MRKIFGIGFPRTGTTSLVQALELLGIRSIHNPSRLVPRIGDPILAQYDGFADNPIPSLYRELDELLPGSKFILTDRRVEEWLPSVAWMIEAGRKHGRWDENPDIVAMHLRLYGASEFREGLFRERFLRHRSEVALHFADRPADLLVLDLTRGDGWVELCAFLELPVPSAAFPHENRKRRSHGLAVLENRWKALIAGVTGRGRH